MTDAASLTPAQVLAHIGDATGELGFLKWVETLPLDFSEPALKVAAAHQVAKSRGMGTLPGRGMIQGIPGKGLMQGLGRLGQAGLTDQQIADMTGLSVADVQAGEINQDPTAPPPAATTVATSTPASTNWLSDIGTVLTNAVSAAGQAYLTVNQVQGANQILQTNLQRAQQGLPPLPYTANQLGLTGPTVNLGLSSSTLTPLLLLGGGALVLFAIIGAMKRR